ncbi:MAG TPA: hypothetical protein VHO70_16015 [Chitinispirillaceae bacterium]|nr:hypothetical protein [Chitinispirillaceae bacterium]
MVKKMIFTVLFLVGSTVHAQDTLSQGMACYLEIVDDWKNQDNITSTGYRDVIKAILSKLPDEDQTLLQARLDALSSAAGNSPEMEKLYIRACSARRAMRMSSYIPQFQKVAFSVHHALGTNYFYGDVWKAGGVSGKGLELLTMNGYYGKVTHLLSNGEARHPDVSFDGKRAIFSWRGGTSGSSDYHLYEMDLTTLETHQLTSGSGEFSVDLDPCYLPNGNVVFVSTRYAQEIDCVGKHWVTNLMLCDKDGKYMRQVGFDQSPCLYPRLLPTGEVMYSRWDYNDKSHSYAHALFTMNPDGTAQREYCNNNSWWPTNIQQERPIPGSTKIMALFCGYHTRQWGKIGIIDINAGTQNGEGITLVAPVRLPKDDHLNKWGDPNGGPFRFRAEDAAAFPKKGAAPLDQWGQDGDMYAYPCPLDEKTFLVSLLPSYRRSSSGWGERMGLFFMTVDGTRELLYLDANGSCMGAIPAMPRTTPPVLSSKVNYNDSMGTFQIMKINVGQSLQGVADGEITRLRVVELYFRSGPEESRAFFPSHCGPGCINFGGATFHTEIATTNASWDAKWIVGEIPVEKDGSVNFRAPARKPLFFQALNAKGQVVQTMRSWATLQPGEVFSCMGCHESKLSAPAPLTYVPIAMQKSSADLEPFYGLRREFNFDKEIQPIFNAKCISCHDGGAKSGGLDLRQSKAYDALTSHGSCDAFSKYVNWMHAEDSPLLQPPNRFGSSKSLLDKTVDAGHKDVKMTDEEMRKIRCWIDIGVPRYGRYKDAFPGTEDNLRYRIAWEEQEKKNIADYLKSLPTVAVKDDKKLVTNNDYRADITFSHSVSGPGILRIQLNVPSLANGEKVRINLYNLQGTLVRTLNGKQVTPGSTIMEFESGAMVSGQYLLEVALKGVRKIKTISVIR